MSPSRELSTLTMVLGTTATGVRDREWGAATVESSVAGPLKQGMTM